MRGKSPFAPFAVLVVVAGAIVVLQGISPPLPTSRLPGVPVPQITSVYPDHAILGQLLRVQITGSETNFIEGTQVTNSVWFSQGSPTIPAELVAVFDDTLLYTRFHIPEDAATGLWDVSVEQVGGEVVTLFDGFLIEDKPPAVSLRGRETSDLDDLFDIGLRRFQIQPNPAQGNVSISYELLRDGPARVEVLDVSGRLVRVLRDGGRIRGAQVEHWDGIDMQGRPLASGVYFVRISTELGAIQRRLTIIR